MTCPVKSLDGAGWPILPLVSLAFLVAACIPIGPNSVKSDQVDYADAISEASKRLTLTNIVKTRYGDAPSYLVASQVVAGYQLQANVAADLDLVRQGGWELGDSGTLTIGGQFSNSPTLTYTPVAGADFSALLLQPIAPADVYALIGGGTPPDIVLGLLLGQINGIRNTLIERVGTTTADDRFQAILDLAAKLHPTGAVHVRVEGTGKDRKVLLVLPEATSASGVAVDVARFRTLLGLDPKKTDFPIVYASGSGAPDAINILTRSISEIIRDLASLIEIPPEDVATGRTYATFTADEVDLKRVRIRARVDVFPPILQDSYVTAYYRGRWFWIEDTDLRSKQVFSFVIELLQLAQRTTAPSLPVVTIPSG